jgi:ubiquinone/menaquinone biosynthesis C-methylase UbiE
MVISMEDRYYLQLVAAFVRGKLELSSLLPPQELIELGISSGLRIHKFKRNLLPRVQHVLGILRGISPSNLLDIGSGRGTFLWPLLDSFPYLQVIASDINLLRASDIDSVRKGGIDNLSSICMDVRDIPLSDKCVDVVTMLEVLEHLIQPEKALFEALRVAGRFVIVSVPSKEDDNPEHIHLFTKSRLEELLLNAGAQRVKVEYILNHMIAVAKVKD